MGIGLSRADSEPSLFDRAWPHKYVMCCVGSPEPNDEDSDDDSDTSSYDEDDDSTSGCSSDE